MSYIKKIKILLFKKIYPQDYKICKVKKIKFISHKKISFNKKIFYNFFTIPNCRLYTDTVNDAAFIYNNNLLREPSYQYRIGRNDKIINGNIKKNFVLINGTPNIRKRVFGNIFSLLSGGAAKNNYWHWLFDVLPKFGILEKSKIKTKIDFFLVPALKKKFQFDTLESLNINFKKILDSEKNKHILSNNMIVTDHPINFNNNPSKSILHIPIWIIFWLRKKFLLKKKKINEFSKIFINRNDKFTSNTRTVTNNKDLINFLRKKNFKILTLSNFTFKEQVEIFNSAKIIIGLHGAGFANIVFSSPNTKIIEIQSKSSGNAICNLSKACGLDYYRIIEKKKSNNLSYQNFKIKINFEKLKIILDKIDI